MKPVLLATALLALSTAAFAAMTPKQEWQASIAEGNKAFAAVPHAMLKIQDAAYLGEDNSASLTGTHGKPETFHWKPGVVPGAILVARVEHGALTMTKGGQPVANTMAAVPIDKDIDIQAFPTQVSAGVIGVRIMLYNQQAAAAKAFKGVSFFDYDPAYRVTATFTPDPKLPPRVFRTSRGTDKQFYHAGEVKFTLKGKQLTLPMYADANDPKKIDHVSAFFTDDMTGKGAYGAGRYIDADVHGFPPKTLILDFNGAYNPNCARSAFFTCPVAIDNLAIAMKAGERDPHFHP
ncbi:MAG TPA: DUF1684 domain-containing protein [Rhizomicrobium sp.]|jgi:uncharacterized protein (DUF1684 family)